ncbi:coadhesin-like [Mercenaria mercenaria]|uniref:coadhesin-like n=1 Tax=Mercenaria mercenaria TaxID=6596 RepID=UPI00234F6361|nr:coadhesin-like [Mercenaria mercenaria]
MFPRKVHGNWGDWASWENICFCNGTRKRSRECDNPRPDYGGTPCPGVKDSFKSCTNEFDCTIYNVALNKSTFSSSENDGFDQVKYNYLAVRGLNRSGCFSSAWEFQPWWMVDLEGVFKLERAVVYLDNQGFQIQILYSSVMKEIWKSQRDWHHVT